MNRKPGDPPRAVVLFPAGVRWWQRGKTVAATVSESSSRSLRLNNRLQTLRVRVPAPGIKPGDCRAQIIFR